MDMVVPGKRRRGRPRRSWIDNSWEDMKKYELTADMTENRRDGEDVEMVSKRGEKTLNDWSDLWKQVRQKQVWTM